ncbi:MAG: CotH kinase family protein [Bryobacteraceae bacterium]
MGKWVRARFGSRGFTLLAGLVVATCATAFAQVLANPFLDDSTVQVINLTMAPTDWAALQQNYLLNTYYHATFTWNGISENIGIRSHGGGSRSPIKPNLDLNFAHYTKTQTFLGLPFVLLKANNEDPSNMCEWLSMKLYRKMGIPAPREAPAQVFVNGQLLGFYYIVEHLDETFLQRDFGESGGYLYEWQSANDYDFENLGTDPTLYSQFLDLKTSQTAPDLQTFDNLVQVINQPASATFTDDAFIAALSQYLDPKQFLTYGATEQVLAGTDSLIGGQQGMNNFYLYQFQGTPVYYFIPWDKDSTLYDWTRDIMYGISNGPTINLLAQRLAAIPQYLQVYLNAVANAATLMGGTGGWADSEITREYGVIQAAALDDPNKQCMVAGVLIPCGNPDFEDGVQRIHTFLASRSSLVLSEAASDGLVASTGGPQIAAAGISALGGLQALSPGGLTIIEGTNLTAAEWAGGVPLPRVIGNTFVSVDGVRSPLLSTATGSMEFEVPCDIPVGDASIVVSSSGDMSGTVDMAVEAATPAIWAAVHGDGSAVLATSPVIAGETISLYATGLGALSVNLPIGAPGPTAPTAATAGLPQILLGGAPLAVTFSGLAPGYVGLYQVNASIPSAPAQGGFTGPFTLTINGQAASWQPALQ